MHLFHRNSVGFRFCFRNNPEHLSGQLLHRFFGMHAVYDFKNILDIPVDMGVAVSVVMIVVVFVVVFVVVIMAVAVFVIVVMAVFVIVVMVVFVIVVMVVIMFVIVVMVVAVIVIMIMVMAVPMLFLLQMYIKIVGINTAFQFSPKMEMVPSHAKTLKRFFQNISAGPQIEKRAHRHITADTGIAFQIQQFFFFFLICKLAHLNILSPKFRLCNSSSRPVC